MRLVFLLHAYLLGAPDFPKVRVPQRRLRGDALVRVVGEHLVEQRQRRRRAARDQPGDAAALFRREVEMHGSGPAGDREKDARLLFTWQGADTARKLATVTEREDWRTHCLNFWRTLWSGVPSTSWILDTWSSSLAPGKRGFKLKVEDLEELSAVTKLFTHSSVRHLLTAAGADGMHTVKTAIADVAFLFILILWAVPMYVLLTVTIPTSPLWDQ